MMTFFGIVFAILAVGALSIIALFLSCDSAAEREQEEQKQHEDY
ncbi:hypothetical protein UFOVP301_34 [uncultured Caudovirales phage]|uniref:Uncharacterized protein n=1 Tax=uncultured Caudovirales phage TaxID=2100421 RepID=A0A6J5RYY5_9CAUD|nr:hypothetical protein UFOVP301_34 [uncultured Caudovirales phage]CAB4150839.1 hypothetical protein UFOVP576_37 [uncultured Caudovirales phage]CAB4199576.1 hypothetical protein UFOVP1350_3 [uncultured Caudovirales phage]